MAAAEPRPPRREGRVLVDTLPVEVAGHGHVRPVAHHLVRPQVELVGPGARGHPAAPLPLALGERGGERLHDPPRELVLQLEDVAERRLESLRRHERAGRRLHELSGRAQLLARAQEGAGQHPVDVGLCRERLEVRRLGREARGGGARANDHRRQPGERRRDRVGQGEREEVDLGVGPQHAEGEDDQSRHRPRHGRSRGAPDGRDRLQLRRHLRGRRGPVGRALGERPAQHAVERHDGRRRPRGPAAPRGAWPRGPPRRSSPGRPAGPKPPRSRIAAAEKRSVRASTSWPSTCSGAM